MNDEQDDEHGGWLPRLVEKALGYIRDERLTLAHQHPGSAAAKLARAERLAELCEREVGWWLALARWGHSNPGAERALLGRAAFEASEFRRQGAQLWRGIAADHRREAAGQRVCSVMGCGCGGVCEVPA